MLCIKDVPNLAMGEGKEMLEMPNGLGRGIAKIIQQWKQDEHDQTTNVDNVPILERMAIESEKTNDHINRRRSEEIAAM